MAPLRCTLALLVLVGCGCDGAEADDTSIAGNGSQTAVVEHDGGLAGSHSGGFAGSIAHAPMTAGAASGHDAGTQVETPSPGKDGGARGDATAPVDDAGIIEPPDEEQRVSDLTAPEVFALCEEVDQRLGLIGDIAAACRVEAWLSSRSEEGCEAVLADCTDAGASGLGLEVGSPCTAQTLPECAATVDAILACANDNGAFFRSRSCDEANLAEAEPACSDELAQSCPALFARN